MNLQQRRTRRQRVAQRAQHLRQQRREARRAKQQANFVGPYTPRQARKVARAQARTEFAPVEREIRSEIRGSARREGELGDWYGQLAGDYATGGQLAAQAFEAAEKATNERLADVSKSSQDTLAKLGAEDSSFATLVGGPQNSAGMAEAAAAAAAAERTRAALQAPLTAMRASNVASYATRTNAARLAGMEAQREERSRRAKQQQDLRSLGRERGQSTVKNFQTLREQEQDRSTQRAALGAKAGYNKALERQAAAGVRSARITATAQVAAARAYSRAKERGASAQEAAAKAYSAAKRRGASAQEATAASNLAAAKIKAKGNVAVAKQQGRNAKNDPASKGGYTVAEGVSLLKSALGTRGFRSPGEAVDYLVNRGVKRSVAKRAAGRFWRVEGRAGGR